MKERARFSIPKSNLGKFITCSICAILSFGLSCQMEAIRYCAIGLARKYLVNTKRHDLLAKHDAT